MIRVKNPTDPHFANHLSPFLLLLHRLLYTSSVATTAAADLHIQTLFYLCRVSLRGADHGMAHSELVVLGRPPIYETKERRRIDE